MVSCHMICSMFFLKLVNFQFFGKKTPTPSEKTKLSHVETILPLNIHSVSAPGPRSDFPCEASDLQSINVYFSIQLIKEVIFYL